MLEKSIATVDVGSLSKRDTVISMAFIGMLFFIFGFVTWVNAILIPYFKIACELSNFQSYLVAFAFYISYLLISVPASFLLKRVGFKKGMMLGFWTMSLGALVFVLAAWYRAYGIFLAGLFSIGAGLAVLQTAANPYITILGPVERAAQRISIMGICNKGAGIIAPLLFAAIIFRPNDAALFNQLHALSEVDKSLQLDLLIRRVIVPYSVVAFVLAGLGLLVRFSPLPEIDTAQETPELAFVNAGKKNIFGFPHLILGALAIFLHVGTQVIAVDTIINYAGTMGIKLLEEKVFPSYTLFATISGYILGIVFIPKYITQLNALRCCTILGFGFSLLIFYTHGPVKFLGHTADISIWFVVALGFANSLVWAAIWPLALSELGKFTKLGASVMIMGLCGNAFLPLVYGHFADAYTPRTAYLVLLPCYAYLIFYAMRGYRLRKWSL